MFGSKRRLEDAKRRAGEKRAAAYRRREEEGAQITKRADRLQELDRARLAEEALLLYKDAQHQLALIRQSIADRTHYDFNPYVEKQEGDIATCLAEDIAHVMRENSVDPQTVWQAMSEQLPDVKFTVDWYDVTSMVAAMMRETHMVGLLHGLELAGVLSDSRKSAR